MKLKEIIQIIEQKYPVNLAESWDNVGLMVGDPDRDIKKVLVSIEANEEIILEAINEQADLIVTHHPFLFKGVKNITTDTYKGRMIHTLIQHGIAIYSMHTNFDIAADGLNDYFMELMGFTDTKILDVTSTDSDEGIGRIADLSKSMSLEQIALLVKEKLTMKAIRVVGDLKRPIHTVAVVTGSGANYISAAMKKGADVLITGDLKYHEAQDAVDAGMCLIDCNHFESEDIFKDVMKRFLETKLLVPVASSQRIINPFTIL